MRFLYTILLYLLTPILLLRLIVRGFRNPAYWQRWEERLGLASHVAKPVDIWLHAVSVGEVRASIPLLEAVMERGFKVLVTNMTPTGSDEVKRQLGDRVQHCYVPYDIHGAVRRFLHMAQPRVAVIMETELWPNLLHQCRRRGVYVVLANVRISPRSFRGYQRVRGFVAQVLANVNVFAVQTELDAQRLRVLGAPGDRLHICGNMKFDIEQPASLVEVAQVLRRNWGQGRVVWVAGSVHEGEDEQVLQSYDELKSLHSELLLVIVPRRPERFGTVARLAERGGRVVVQRSQHKGPLSGEVDIYIGDTMGELSLFYLAAEIAFVGGSLIPHGGQNILEPCAAGTPVVFGPYMFNFREISVQALQCGAGKQVKDQQELTAVIDQLLRDPNLRFRMGEAGKKMVEDNKGAVAKTMALVEQGL